MLRPEATVLGRILTLLSVALGLLVTAPAALAVDPAAYLSAMPSSAKVAAAFVGSDALDTAAQQFAAFFRLEDMTRKMIGDRGPAGHALQAEADLLDSYTNAYQGIKARVQAGMPEDQRGFYIGTQFTAWSQTVDRYQVDPRFNQAFRNLFSGAFQTTYARLLSDLETADAAPLTLPTATPPLTGSSKVIATAAGYAVDYAPFFVLLAIYLVLFALMGPKRRPAQGDKAPRS
jgi:hypothetical protein